MYDVVLSEANEKLSTAVLLVSPKSYNYLKKQWEKAEHVENVAI